MQGIIFDIKRFAIHDGPGIRTTVFFKGCPLNCKWCHNPESILPTIEQYKAIKKIGDKEFDMDEVVGYTVSIESVMTEILKEKVFMEEGNGGVTISGGEPLFQPDFALELLKACKNEGLHTTVDTSGGVPKATLEIVLPYTDLFLYDIKTADSELHKRYTGVNNELIWGNLEYLIASKANIVIRIPVLPTINDNQMEEISERLNSIKFDDLRDIHLLPYHKIGAKKYQRFNLPQQMLSVSEPSQASLEAYAKIFRTKGFNVVSHR